MYLLFTHENRQWRDKILFEPIYNTSYTTNVALVSKKMTWPTRGVRVYDVLLFVSPLSEHTLNTFDLFATRSAMPCVCVYVCVFRRM